MQREHAEEMARMHERLRSSNSQKAALSEKLVHAEARIEQLGHEIKRAEEVIAGKNSLLQELQATAQRERVEMEAEIKRLTFALQESTMLRNRDHEDARQRKMAEQRDIEQAQQRSQRSAAEQEAVRTKMLNVDEELRAAVQVESLLITRTAQIVSELQEWV